MLKNKIFFYALLIAFSIASSAKIQNQKEPSIGENTNNEPVIESTLPVINNETDTHQSTTVEASINENSTIASIDKNNESQNQSVNNQNSATETETETTETETTTETTTITSSSDILNTKVFQSKFDAKFTEQHHSNTTTSQNLIKEAVIDQSTTVEASINENSTIASIDKNYESQNQSVNNQNSTNQSQSVTSQNSTNQSQSVASQNSTNQSPSVTSQNSTNQSQSVISQNSTTEEAKTEEAKTGEATTEEAKTEAGEFNIEYFDAAVFINLTQQQHSNTTTSQNLIKEAVIDQSTTVEASINGNSIIALIDKNNESQNQSVTNQNSATETETETTETETTKTTSTSDILNTKVFQSKVDTQFTEQHHSNTTTSQNNLTEETEERTANIANTTIMVSFANQNGLSNKQITTAATLVGVSLGVVIIIVIVYIVLKRKKIRSKRNDIDNKNKGVYKELNQSDRV